MKHVVIRCIAGFLFAASLAALGANDAPAPRKDIDELMVKSGLWVQVAQFRTAVEQGIDAYAAIDVAQGKPGLGEAEMAKLKASARKAFDADRMRAETRDELARLMEPEDIRQVLVWLNSGLGARITRMEENHGAATDQAAAAKQQELIKEHAKTLGADRLSLLGRLARATHAGEFAADILINSTTATMLAMAAVTPLSDKGAINDLRKRMEEQRANLIVAYDAQAASQFGYAYRSLSDSELEKYLAFAQSGAGERYHAASLEAMKTVIVQATYAFATELGLEAKKEKPSRS
jgi:hypothetical protein